MCPKPDYLERRYHLRVHLGVPVRAHYAGEVRTLTLELANASPTGCYFKTEGPRPRLGQWVAFGFVATNRSVCTAGGRAVRIDYAGFAVKFERINQALRTFLVDNSIPTAFAA